MKDKTFFKAPAHFTAITPLLICIMLLTSCARIGVYIHRNDPVEKPVSPVKVRVIYDGSINYIGTILLAGGGELAPIQDS